MNDPSPDPPGVFPPFPDAFPDVSHSNHPEVTGRLLELRNNTLELHVLQFLFKVPGPRPLSHSLSLSPRPH